jgi:tetratricopeptide (TPR) repeat protein
MRSALLLAALLLSTAAARSTAPAPAPPSPDSPLHSYVLGRYAYSSDALDEAARYFDVARAQNPSPALTRRAFDLAVAAGEKQRAFDLATQLVTAGNKEPDVALIRLAQAIDRNDWAAAQAARANLADAGYASVVGPIVDAWILYGKGERRTAIDKLDPAAFTGFARSYIAEQRAHMLAADGRYAEAASLYAELRAGTGAGISFLRAGEADARAMTGDKAGAAALLTGSDPTVVAARARLEAGKRIGALAPDPRRGIAWMMSRLASDLSRDKPVPLALLFARTGTFMAPDIAATWMIAGDVLARNGQNEAALAAYAMVPAGDALAGPAQDRRAAVLEEMGRNADAGALLTAATQRPRATADDWTRLGDWNRRGDRFDAAIAAYGEAIRVAGPDASWGLYFLRGSMNERGGHWPQGEADLRTALKLSPDEPIVLNYLGYSLLDRGEKQAEAVALVERAAKLRPGDGGVIDSLGWAQYRQGRYAEAVATLERAQALEPNDPTLVEHLGDAYWKVGRRIEARFRWRQALDLDPTEVQKKALDAKLDYGLDAAVAMAGVAKQP